MNLQKKLLRWFSFLAVFTVFFSCEKDVVLDLADKEGSFLVVEANLTDDGRKQWIRLSESSSYYESSFGNPVSGALVQITDGQNTFTFTESDVDTLAGHYYNNQISNAFTQTTYQLQISHNENVYTAESEFRPVPVLDSVTVELSLFSQLGFGEIDSYDVYVHFEEFEEEGDYYLFNMYVRDTLETARPNQKNVLSDESLQDYVSLSVLGFNEEEVLEGDRLVVEIRSISEENYNFYNIFFFQTDLSGNPFAGAPPANIPTNLSNGAKGFFQVSSVYRDSIIFQKPQD
ncbi:MAG: DUF4249 domain-containing protein [Bacteroidota bacterium]